MDEFYENYYDGCEDDFASISFPYPEELYLSSWDREIATSDDWLDTVLFIKEIKESIK